MTGEMLIVRAIGWALLQFLWQGTAIGVGLVAVLALLRHRTAQARYLASCAALAAMLGAPIVTAAGQYQLLRKASPASAAIVAVRSADAAPASAATLEPSIRTAPGAVRAARDAGAPRSFSFTMTRRQLDEWLPVAVTLWLGGVLALSARLLGGWLVAERLRRRLTHSVTADLEARVAALIEALGIRRVVRVLESELVVVPTMVGWLRPVVLLPVGVITGLSAAQLEAVIVHELAHIARHDFIVNVVQTAVETLLFFHPAVWWTSQQMRVEREHCCDDIAVRVSGDRVAYANALTSLEEFRNTRMAIALSATGGALMNRVQRVLGVSEPGARRSRAGAAVCLALAIGALMIGTPRAATQTSQAPARDRLVPVDAHVPPAPVDAPAPPTLVDSQAAAARSQSAAAEYADRTREQLRRVQESLRQLVDQQKPVPDIEYFDRLNRTFTWRGRETQVQIKDGRFRHVDSGIEFAVPQGWRVANFGRSSDNGDGATLIAPSGEVLSVWMIRTDRSPEGARATGQDDWYRYNIGMKIRMRYDQGLRDYWVAGSSINQRMIGRTMGLTAIGEYTDEGVASAEYLAWINGKTARVFFYGRGAAATLPQRQPLYETVVDTAIVP